MHIFFSLLSVLPYLIILNFLKFTFLLTKESTHKYWNFFYFYITSPSSQAIYAARTFFCALVESADFKGLPDLLKQKVWLVNFLYVYHLYVQAKQGERESYTHHDNFFDHNKMSSCRLLWIHDSNYHHSEG